MCPIWRSHTSHKFQFPVEIHDLENKIKTECSIYLFFLPPSASQQEVAWLRDRRVTNPVTANILSSSENGAMIEDPQQTITRLGRSDMETHGSIVRGRNVCLPVRSNTTCRRAEESCSLARENNKRHISLSLPGFTKPVEPVKPVRFRFGPVPNRPKFKIQIWIQKNEKFLKKYFKVRRI